MTILNRLYASSRPEVIIETLQINIGDEVHYLCNGYDDITATTENGDTVEFKACAMDVALPARNDDGTGIITPHEMVEELQSGFTVPSDDDFDGVDVTYINGVTWAEETVKCRTPDNPTPVKIENYKLDGVLNQDHAYQIGMRRLMKYLQQRVTYPGDIA